MDKDKMLEACLALQRQAGELFDLIEAKGLDAPMESIEKLNSVRAITLLAGTIKEYYIRRAIGDMINLGVSPETLFKLGRGLDG